MGTESSGPTEPPQKLPKFRIGWKRNLWEWNLWEWNLWESATEPAEKLPKCRLGWDGNLWEWNLWESAAEPAEKLPKFRISCVVVVVVGCLRVAQRPPEGAKTTEIPDRLDPPSRHKNFKHSGFAVVGCWLLVGCCCCLRVAQRPPEGANISKLFRNQRTAQS